MAPYAAAAAAVCVLVTHTLLTQTHQQVALLKKYKKPSTHACTVTFASSSREATAASAFMDADPKS